MVKVVMMRRGFVAALLCSGLAAAGMAGSPAHAATAGMGQPPQAGPGFALQAGVKRACPPSVTPGVASCSALVSASRPAGDPAVKGVLATTPVGYSPANLQAAYGLASGSEGMRARVAIVVAFDDPTAEADLGIYRAQYGLPPCTTADGCFQKVDLSSSPVANSGWAQEASIDMDVVSAVCPMCHITLVEAQADDIPDLGTAVDTAVSDGAEFVDNSYYTPETSGEVGSTGYDQFYDHPGVAVVAAAGDAGYGVSYPAASPDVTAVGGTVLDPDSSVSRGWTETAWSGTGSGCSAYEPKPTWQGNTGCSNRLDNDVSAVAASTSSQTPVAYYDSYNQTGWLEGGGTSVSTAVITGAYALAGIPPTTSTSAEFPYQYPGLLNPVTSGSNGTCTVTLWCTAGSGYNGPAGNGTPASNIPFTYNGENAGYIRSGVQAKCLDDNDGSTADNNKVDVWTCDFGITGQVWTVADDGTIQIAGGCLDVLHSGTANGTLVDHFQCNKTGAQQWRSGLNGSLINPESGKCLTDPGSSTTNGTQLEISTCNGSAAQDWILPYEVPRSTGEFKPQANSAVCIGQNTSSSTHAATLFDCDGDSNQTWSIHLDGSISAASGDCLDVHDSGTANGTEIDYAACDRMNSQEWQIEPDGSLLNPESGKCLAPSGNSAAAGTALVLEPCSFTTIQEWALPPL
ncbi:MAG: ricin-type beta-trefoil lectin domain protein [Streptosporangiaceae bacterium]|nr:ricin-type beta-trefoil lectin domain protein [Streptosporangiaceae bacterium]